MFIIQIFKFLLNIIYIPFKWLRPDAKILFLSRQANKPTLEYNLLIYELKRQNNELKIVTITKKLEKNFISVCSNFFLLFRQMYHIATSKIVVIDGYSIPISILKHRKDLIVIQMWHANGIIKKIGLQTLNVRTPFQRKLAIAMNMHKNYSYVVASSRRTGQVFEEAFGVEEEQILNFGTPKLDYIYHRDNYLKKDMKKKYSIASHKKVIVYMPTYRNKGFDCTKILNNFDFDKYELVMKLHPVDENMLINTHDERFKKVKIIKNEDSSNVIGMADYVITDYSNIAFEAILSDKKTYFYLYDYDEYEKKFGFNIYLKKEIPELCFNSFDKLMQEIKKNKYPKTKAKKFVFQYIDNYDGHCTERIAAYILEKMKD